MLPYMVDVGKKEGINFSVSQHPPALRTGVVNQERRHLNAVRREDRQHHGLPPPGGVGLQAREAG